MSDGLVPIGTIIDWWRDEDSAILQPFPAGYQLCDGSEITEGPLKGLKTPNLNSLFIRGTTAADQIGKTGGATTAKLPASTGSCYNDGGDPGKTSYLVRDDNQNWTTDCHLRVDGGDSTLEGQHRHTLGGTVTTVPPYYTLLKLMRVV